MWRREIFVLAKVTQPKPSQAAGPHAGPLLSSSVYQNYILLLSLAVRKTTPSLLFTLCGLNELLHYAAQGSELDSVSFVIQSVALNMGALGFSETLVSTFNPAWLYNPEAQHQQLH
jgi:hypothetical protein